MWIHSSVGRASHRYRGGHGFESRWSPDFFQASPFQLLKLEKLLRWSLTNIISFKNKEIVIGGKQFFWSDRFKKGSISIRDLWDETGSLLTFQAFSLKYSCRASFLQHYQVLSAIPKNLLSTVKQTDTLNKSFFTSNDNIFRLNDSIQINFTMARSRDFYKLLVSKTHTHAWSNWPQTLESKFFYK